MDKSLQHSKETLCTSPILSLPDTSANAGLFLLDADTTDTAIGAVVSQKSADNQERVIACGIRTLDRSGRNCCTARKKMLVVVHFVKHFQQYLLRRTFLLRTDHASLHWLRNFKDPQRQTALHEYECE